MIILPTQRPPKILLPVPDRGWREPSLAQPKDEFGRQDRTRFRLTARLHDGHVAWRGWFADRDDADAFLFAVATGSLRYERALWGLPAPAWRPDIGEVLSYDFATVTILTSTPGSNQTFNVPSDWNNGNNLAEVIGGGTRGENGGTSTGNTHNGPGGGAGAFSAQTNITLTPGGTATYRIGVGGSTTTAFVGGDSWFNGATLAGSSVGAKGASFSSGGAAASGVGATKRSGGNGGAKTNGVSIRGSGGGGAAGPDDDGGAGSTGTSGTSGAGGGANNGTSGNANGATPGTGADGGGNGGSPGNAGTAGTTWESTHGPGGGGGGSPAGGASNGAAGGNYGAGGGGGGGPAVVDGAVGVGIDGRQGIVVVTYAPAGQHRMLLAF